MTRPDQLHILLLSESEALAALDRRALRDAGASRVDIMTSGVQAARMLAGLSPGANAPRPDAVVCGQKLADMDGEQFCAILRLHPLLLALPVLLILPNDSEVEQLKTLGCGASALLGRPYSVTDIKNQLETLAASEQRLSQLQKAAQLADTKAFDAALATYGMLLKPVRQPEDYFRVGMQCLQQSRWNNAINAFQRALRSAQIQGEAELGMAAAWKGKGDLARCRVYLAQAAATFVRARRWHRARAVYARLLQEDPAAKSPFLTEARQLMRQGHYDEAAEVLAQGFEMTSQSQLSDKVAQTCLTAEEPRRMLEALENSLGRVMGQQGVRLSDDIRESLDDLIRRQEERRRQAASERQWRASRQMARQRENAEQDEEIAAKREEQATEAALAALAGSPTAPSAVAGAGETRPTGGGRPRTSVITGTSVPTFDAQEAHFAVAGSSLSPVSDGKAAETAPVAPAPLEPLTEAEATSGLFYGRPGLNELLSVMKLTWKLARR